MRHVGHFSVMDGAPRRVGDTATMTHIGTLHGDHFSAERDGRDLKLFSNHDEYGAPAQREFPSEEGTSGIRSTAGAGLDAAPESLAELNAMHRRHHAAAGHVRPRRRA
jgi:hypothetical protein